MPQGCCSETQPQAVPAVWAHPWEPHRRGCPPGGKSAPRCLPQGKVHPQLWQHPKVAKGSTRATVPCALGETEARGEELQRQQGQLQGGHSELGSRVQSKVTQMVLGTAEPGMLSETGMPPAVTHPVPGSSSSSYRLRWKGLNGARPVARHPWDWAPTHRPSSCPCTLQPPHTRSASSSPHPRQKSCFYWSHTCPRMGPPTLPSQLGGDLATSSPSPAPVPGEQSS